eukprot:2566262-Amphidinium_carterae.1
MERRPPGRKSYPVHANCRQRQTTEEPGTKDLIIGTNGGPKQMRVKMAAVRKPLLAVSDMCQKGHDVHFLADGCAYAIHTQSKVRIDFACRDGVCEIDA